MNMAVCHPARFELHHEVASSFLISAHAPTSGIRELTLAEIEFVSGAYSWSDAAAATANGATIGAAIGGTVGVVGGGIVGGTAGSVVPGAGTIVGVAIGAAGGAAGGAGIGAAVGGAIGFIAYSIGQLQS